MSKSEMANNQNYDFDSEYNIYINGRGKNRANMQGFLEDVIANKLVKFSKVNFIVSGMPAYTNDLPKLLQGSCEFLLNFFQLVPGQYISEDAKNLLIEKTQKLLNLSTVTNEQTTIEEWGEIDLLAKELTSFFRDVIKDMQN
ncbi:MAG: hypothetical protein ABI721_00675 [Candidatus Dojkabacteria bacterium]